VYESREKGEELMEERKERLSGSSDLQTQAIRAYCEAQKQRRRAL